MSILGIEGERNLLIKSVVTTVYHFMQRHYLSFRFLVWLKEKGVTRRVNFLISHSDDSDKRIHPTDSMIRAKRFYSDKEVSIRLKQVKKLLADEKSREVMDACIAYRTKRIPIPNKLYSEHDQYFVADIIHLSQGEIFVDGGAYTGDTIQQLFDVAKRQRVDISQVIAYEPDSDNYFLLNKFFGKRSNISIYKKGLSNESKEIFFKSTGVTARIVDDEKDATGKISVVDIDSIEECKNATFIKMDIEGAEWDALHGARETIVRNKPQLAICLYHSDEDMIRLVEYVHSLVPEYKLYIRHHSRSDVETVLYAIA
jgi:FkbM family methyltransferase